MRRLWRALLARAWKATEPHRGEYADQIEQQLMAAIDQRLTSPARAIERIETALAAAAAESAQASARHEARIARVEQQALASHQASEAVLDETNLLLDCLLREVARLQLQMEEVREMLARPRVVLSPHEPDAETTEAA